MSPLMRRIIYKITKDASLIPKRGPTASEKKTKVNRVFIAFDSANVSYCWLLTTWFSLFGQNLQKPDGYGPFLSRVQRFQYAMSDGSRLYNPNDWEKWSVRQTLHPFGLPRDAPLLNRWASSCSTTPGPGTYTMRSRKNVIRESFHGPRSIVPATRTLCMPIQTTLCAACGERPIGDYWQNWHSDMHEAMCRRCMLIERKRCSKLRRMPAYFKRKWYLEQFERVRYCGYCHEHNRTTASLKLWPNKQLKKKFQIENYLAMFEI